MRIIRNCSSTLYICDSEIAEAYQDPSNFLDGTEDQEAAIYGIDRDQDDLTIPVDVFMHHH